jgi:parallel beta-helix repeat protein
MDKKSGLLVIWTTILVLSFVGTASAMTWNVDDDGEGDFSEIQDAINNASDGDTILVHSGIYYENVVVDKSVTLRGIGHPVVDAGGRESAITLSADGIAVKGFNVTKSSWDGAGITISSSNNTITGNTVCHSNNSGIALFSSSNNTITDNNISNSGCGIGLLSSGNNNDYGIGLWFSSNNTITGNNVSNNNEEGIFLFYSRNNTITGNNVSNNNEEGIFLFYSRNNTITGNNVSNNNEAGILLFYSRNNSITGNTHVNDGLFVYSSYQNTGEDNTVNGKPLVYLEDVSDYKVENAGQVILVNCSKITVENLDISNTSLGIELWGTEDSIISNNTVSNNNIVIFLGSSSNNTITGNNLSNNNWDGISLTHSSNNKITGNNVCNNNMGGIRLFYSSNNNTITGNNVCNNNKESIRLDNSSNNKIYFNNFINNTDNVDSYISSNIWNSPLEITYTYDGTTYKSYLGSYWDDYEGTDAEGDGIGNTHYSIDSDSDESDDYPLMKPFENYILL